MMSTSGMIGENFLQVKSHEQISDTREILLKYFHKGELLIIQKHKW